MSITAGTDYVAAYLAPNGHYSYMGSAFAAGGVTNGPLTAASNGSVVTGDGVYSYSSSSTFPTSSYNAANYWVDVLFQPSGSGGGTSGPPTAPTNVTAAPASSQARVAWAPPSSNGGSPITSYTVTPYAGTTAGTPVQVSGSASTATVTGLTDGTAYTFTVTATNAQRNRPGVRAHRLDYTRGHDLRFCHAGHRRFRRRLERRARSQLHGQDERDRHGHPFLQGGRKHRIPRRQPLDGQRTATRVGHVHQ